MTSAKKSPGNFSERKKRKMLSFPSAVNRSPEYFANGHQESFVTQIRLLVSVMNEESHARSSKAAIMIHWAASK